MAHPAFESDQPTATDAFGRIEFAKGLARSLNLPANAPGLVVGIEGEWGSGKSTLINFVKMALEEQEEAPLLVDFNPWMISGSESLECLEVVCERNSVQNIAPLL